MPRRRRWWCRGPDRPRSARCHPAQRAGSSPGPAPAAAIGRPARPAPTGEGCGAWSGLPRLRRGAPAHHRQDADPQPRRRALPAAALPDQGQETPGVVGPAGAVGTAIGVLAKGVHQLVLELVVGEEEDGLPERPTVHARRSSWTPSPQVPLTARLAGVFRSRVGGGRRTRGERRAGGWRLAAAHLGRLLAAAEIAVLPGIVEHR